jgi:serine/threonine protein kinase
MPAPSTSPDGSFPPRDVDGAVTEAVPAELTQLERYRVVHRLGSGGMGVVYAAEHRFLRRPVALKVIHRRYTAETAVVERFCREARAAAKLDHPNIVAAYDAEHAGDLHFLIMEYVEGKTLSRVLAAHGPLPVTAACDHVRQAALGLQHAHERGMVHRDLKPDNLMLTPDGTVKILDFGLAALTAERDVEGLTELGAVVGTPDYMAPEQAEDARTADIRADIYSLGCTLYHLLTDSLPYPAPTAVLKILAHRDRPVPSVRAVRPEVPKQLEAVLARLLAKKPADRYQTPAEVAAALTPFAQPASSPPRKRRTAALQGVFLLAGAILLAALYHIRTDEGELRITTESDDVEVVVKQSGKVVRIVDTRTDREITLTLRSGVYELELKGPPRGLKLSIDKATLTRGKTELARIERVPVGEKKEPAKWGLAELPDRPGLLCTFPHATGRNDQSSIVVSPDGLLIAVVADREGVDNSIRVYESATGRLVREVEYPLERAVSCVFLGDNRHLLITSNPLRSGARYVRIRNLETGSERRLLDLEAVVDCWPPFAPSGDGKRLWERARGLQVGVFDLETERLVRPLSAPWIAPGELVEQFAALSAEGKWLAVVDSRRDREDSSRKRGRLTIHDVAGNRPALPILVQGFVGAPFFHPDGGQVGALCRSPEGYRIEYWNLETGKSVRRVPLAARHMEMLQLPTNRVLAGTDDTGRFAMFDTATGKVLFRPGGTGSDTIRTSADGRVAAVFTVPRQVYRLPERPAERKP